MVKKWVSWWARLVPHFKVEETSSGGGVTSLALTGTCRVSVYCFFWHTTWSPCSTCAPVELTLGAVDLEEMNKLGMKAFCILMLVFILGVHHRGWVLSTLLNPDLFFFIMPAGCTTGNATWRRRWSIFFMSCEEGPEAYSTHRSRKDQTYQRNGVSFALASDFLYFFLCLSKIRMTHNSLLLPRVIYISDNSSVQLLSCVWLFMKPWITARQAFLLPIPGICSNSCPSSRWCHPTISSSVVPFSSCPQSFPASGSFQMSQFFTSDAKVLEFQLQHQSFQWNPGLISFSIDWLALLDVQGTLKNLLQHRSSKASILRRSAFLIVQLSHLYMPTGKIIALTRWTFVGKVMSHFLICCLGWS